LYNKFVSTAEDMDVVDSLVSIFGVVAASDEAVITVVVVVLR
jgi:hypothetical protein